MGHYDVVEKPTDISSPKRVIPKPDNEVRFYSDCSRPERLSVNDNCTSGWQQRFSQVDDVASLVAKGCYTAKVDLKSAHRTVPIIKHSQRFTGLQWQFGDRNIYLRDTRLPFGSKLPPGIFHRLTQAVRRMFRRHGLAATVVYLDDFFIKADTFEQCLVALNWTITLLRKLGFQINWNKVVNPFSKITVLGKEIDSEAMCLKLPDEKLVQIRQELDLFLNEIEHPESNCNLWREN